MCAYCVSSSLLNHVIMLVVLVLGLKSKFLHSRLNLSTPY